jgi:formiminoglutamase
LTAAHEDPRLGGLIGPNDPSEARVVLIGFPSDEGVRRNGGRPGAADGPGAIRQALHKLTPDARHPGPFRAVLACTADGGDVEVTGDLERDQERLADTVAEVLERGAFPIVLGGGHETAFGHALGHVRAGRRVRIVNLDAHADVRPLKAGRAHSGSPFRQALEHPAALVRRYDVAGLQPYAVASEHLAFVRIHGLAVFADETTPDRIASLIDGMPGDPDALLTLDLDGADASQAPGVSAPTAAGLDASLYFSAAYLAGRHRAVRSMDVCELAPRYDEGGRTAKLAALCVWHLLRGLAQRPGFLD